MQTDLSRLRKEGLVTKNGLLSVCAALQRIEGLQPAVQTYRVRPAVISNRLQSPYPVPERKPSQMELLFRTNQIDLFREDGDEQIVG